jgi:hypothetical protein
MTCAIAGSETLFDISPARPVRDCRYEREGYSAFANLFEVPTEIVRRRGGEIALRPEEDLERWDGQS